VLAAVFVTWQRTEKTLSFHSVDTFRREAFYWAAVVATFALGARRPHRCDVQPGLLLFGVQSHPALSG
jgi:hypothetical protein